MFVGVGHLIGCAAEDHHPGRRSEVAQQRGEELVEAAQRTGFGDAGGVEHQAAEGVGPPAAEVVSDYLVVVGECRSHGLGQSAVAADQQNSGQRRITGPVAPQRIGRGQPELLGQKGPRGGVDHLRQKVGSHTECLSLLRIPGAGNRIGNRIGHELTPE